MFKLLLFYMIYTLLYSKGASDNSISAEQGTDITESTSSFQPTITTSLQPYQLEDIIRWQDTDIRNASYITVQVEHGYFISVTVENITMPDGDFLLIRGGNSNMSQFSDGRIFANTVAGPLKYLFQTTSVYAFYHIEDDDSTYTFVVTFEKIGEPKTTVPTITTTTDIWPTPPKNDNVYITVNVSGRILSDYSQQVTRQAFQDCVAKMASDFCNSQHIYTSSAITRENVQISDISACPFTWPGSNTCVQIRFKLPILQENDGRNSSYRLTSADLVRMWSQYANDAECFKSNMFFVYAEPDFDDAITWWAIGIGLVVILFIVLLWFLRAFGSQLTARIKRRRNSDTMSIISSKRDSTLSMGRHYLQDIPKFFEP